MLLLGLAEMIQQIPVVKDGEGSVEPLRPLLSEDTRPKRVRDNSGS